MVVVVAYYVDDVAGRGIAHKLISYANCVEGKLMVRGVSRVREAFVCEDRGMWVLGFDIDVIELEILDALSSMADYYVVLSRHSAKSGKPSLTTHPTGNPWGRSDAGGKPWEIPPSNPVLMWYILNELRNLAIEKKLSNYNVCYEVTHHGPTSVSKPITFVELGSSETEWRDNRAQDAIALATLNAIEKTRKSTERDVCIVSVGFGGPHYAPLFTRRAFDRGECYGHMVPEYAIKELTVDELRFVAQKVIEQTPNVKRVVTEKMRHEFRKVIDDVARAKGLEVIRY